MNTLSWLADYLSDPYLLVFWAAITGAFAWTLFPRKAEDHGPVGDAWIAQVGGLSDESLRAKWHEDVGEDAEQN